MADRRETGGISAERTRGIDRRKLLRGVVAGGPAILTLYGGRAWAASSCGQIMHQVSPKAEFDMNNTDKLQTLNQLLVDAGKQPITDTDGNALNGLQHSCLVSYNSYNG